MLEFLKGMPLFRRISVQLAMLLVGLVAISVGIFGLFAYQLANSSLEEELGHRLVTVARIGAGQLEEEDLAALVPRGKAYQRLQGLLENLARRSGVERLLLFDAGGRVLVDSRGELKWGETYFPLKLDLVEWRWAMRGKAVDTPLFSAGGSGQMFKSALAPVMAPGGSVTGILRAEADAAFLSVARTLAWSMVALGGVSLALALAFAAWASRPVVRPVNELIHASRRVAAGDFTVRVSDQGRGEIAEAGRTFNEMTKQLAVFVKEKERLATLGELSAGVAHEIRNPLAAIEGFAGLLEKKLSGREREKEYAQEIMNEVRTLNRFITDFLDFSRPSPPRLEVAQLRDVAEAATRVALPPRSRKWKVETSGREVEAVVDPSQLRQVLVNLMKNAREAMPGGGTIRVRTGRRDGRVFIEVEDQGRGMDAATVEQLFTPFFTTKPMGTGLGLAIALKLVEAIGGRLDVSSEEGKGSRFVLSVPDDLMAHSQENHG